ncbi:DUF896 domain-containing protein [Veillonella sp. VA142]|uniref:DUF896 domain-containing protein n=1 Tax=Veillonella sp. VA142 TaxID=741834 RepID=UPI001F0BD362|nr:DUF896 domain-containing protein [Veillonella sp. VA142]
MTEQEKKDMTMEQALTRINALAAKKKSGQTLTEEELAEKKDLYEVYLGFIRAQVVQHLESIEFVDAEPDTDTVEVDVELDTKYLRKSH